MFVQLLALFPPALFPLAPPSEAQAVSAVAAASTTAAASTLLFFIDMSPLRDRGAGGPCAAAEPSDRPGRGTGDATRTPPLAPILV
ncbi:hypothetical protein GCM10023259_030010 [Thermocatellispora tengchongensis]